MPRESIAIPFFKGERGSLAAGRIDVEGYNQSLSLCENFIPTVQGPLKKRRGTKYLGSVKTPADVTRLIPYKIDSSNALMLECGSNYIRMWNEDGTYTTNELAYGSTPAQWASTKFAQTEDLLFLVHNESRPSVFTSNATGSTAAGAAQVFDFGPLQEENVDQDYFLQMAASTGAGAITCKKIDAGGTQSNVTSGNLNRLIGFRCIPQMLYDQWVAGTAYVIGNYRWSQSYESDRVNVYRATSNGTSGTRAPGHDLGTELDGIVGWQMVHSEYGFVRISGEGDYSGGGFLEYSVGIVGFPEVPADTTTGTAHTSGTFRHSFGAWFDDNQPESVTFHEQRAVYGGCTSARQTLWGSQIDYFTNFYPSTIASGAYEYQVNSEDNSQITDLVSFRNLFVFTANGQFVASTASQGPITPTDISINKDSSVKAKNQMAIAVDDSIMFVQKGGRTLRETIFNDDKKQFSAHDISYLSNSIADLGFNELVYQSESDKIIWSYGDAGELLGLTFDKDLKSMEFHRHTLAQTSTGASAVESIAIAPDENGVNDRLWMIVNRTINGGTVRYIEMIDEDTDCWLDSYIEYSGAATTTITGLAHLEGEEVTVVSGDAVIGAYTVSSGQITGLAQEVTAAFVGLDYTAVAVTQKLEGGSQNGVSQGKLKRIHSAIVRLDQTGLGLKLGSNAGNMSPVLFRDTNDLMDSGIPVYTGDQLVPLKGGNDSEGIIRIEHTLPLPCTIVALWPQIEVSDNT